MTAIPTAPEGDYVIVQVKTNSENKGSALETITPMSEGGVWKVPGYYIK